MLRDGALHRHSAAEADAQRAEVEPLESRRVQQGVEQRVDAGEERKRVLGEFADERLEVPRVRDHDIVRAEPQHREAVRRQREDVVQRQRRDRDERFARLERRLHPGLGLQHVRDQVAVRQHGALGNARRAAGVLQEGDVLRPERDGDEILVPPLAERLGEGHGAGQAPFRHLLAQVAQHEVHDGRLREAEQVPDTGDDDGLEADLAADVLQRVGEVLENHQCTRTGIVQLVPQLARRVQRVRVDDREAGTQRAEDRDRVLQHVRQHDRDAIAVTQPCDLLQVGGESRAEHVEVAVRQRPVHAGEAGPVAIPLDALLEQVQQRRMFRRVDLGGHAGRVMLEPDPVHDRSPA